MLSSFQVVCGRSTQASLEALTLFTENDPTTLQWQMKEDAMLLAGAKLQFNALKGEKFELNRVCARIDVAIDTIFKGNTAIFGACEAVIEGAKLPKPRLNPLCVRATRPRMDDAALVTSSTFSPKMISLRNGWRRSLKVLSGECLIR
jgi:hypothetical protein